MGEPATTLRVLLADDDATARLVLSYLVASSMPRVELHQAHDGDHALELLRDARAAGAPYDLLLTDHEMPGFHGAILLAVAREESPTTARVLITSNADMERIARDVAEADAFFTKPLRGEGLREFLRGLAARPRGAVG